jgi:hypothetical protein
MKTERISTTIPTPLLRQGEQIARQKGITQPELMREAYRRYVIKNEFDRLASYGKQRSKARGLKSSDVNLIIGEVRRSTRNRSR